MLAFAARAELREPREVRPDRPHFRRVLHAEPHLPAQVAVEAQSRPLVERVRQLRIEL